MAEDNKTTNKPAIPPKPNNIKRKPPIAKKPLININLTHGAPPPPPPPPPPPLQNEQDKSLSPNEALMQVMKMHGGIKNLKKPEVSQEAQQEKPASVIKVMDMTELEKKLAMRRDKSGDLNTENGGVASKFLADKEQFEKARKEEEARQARYEKIEIEKVAATLQKEKEKRVEEELRSKELEVRKVNITPGVIPPPPPPLMNSPINIITPPKKVGEHKGKESSNLPHVTQAQLDAIRGKMKETTTRSRSNSPSEPQQVDFRAVLKNKRNNNGFGGKSS